MDTILYWNETALETHRLDFSGAVPPEQGGPTATSRALAMVHLAMRDAWVFSSQAMNPAAPVWYIPAAAFPGGVAPSFPAGASSEAAVAGAAVTVLQALYLRSADYLDQRQSLFTAILLGTQGQPNIDAGFAFGREIGEAMLRHRSADGSAVPGKYVPTNACGAHRPDPYNPGQGYLGPNWGNVTLFTPGFAGVASKPYPAMGSAHYLRDFNEVKQKGAFVSPTRSNDETVQGLFWAYDGAKDIGVPPRLYNQVVREIARIRGNTVDQNARLFALINMAMADAGITAWKEKYIHNLWRPVIGVREAGADFGPGACAGMPPTLVADPFWRPLGSPASNTRNPSFTPGFPAYPSGHATFGTATFETVRDFYYPGLPSGLDPNGIDPKARAVRDTSDIAFEFVSDELNGKTMDPDGSLRTLHRRALTLSKSIDENKRSRVFLGVHWQFDADWGDEIGLNIAAAAKTAL